jgi:uncharacterized protein YbdZ (MbtH family)
LHLWKLALTGFVFPQSQNSKIAISPYQTSRYVHIAIHKLALFFQIVLCHKRQFRIWSLMLRISGQWPVIGFVFSNSFSLSYRRTLNAER